MRSSGTARLPSSSELDSLSPESKMDGGTTEVCGRRMPFALGSAVMLLFVSILCCPAAGSVTERADVGNCDCGAVLLMPIGRKLLASGPPCFFSLASACGCDAAAGVGCTLPWPRDIHENCFDKGEGEGEGASDDALSSFRADFVLFGSTESGMRLSDGMLSLRNDRDLLGSAGDGCTALGFLCNHVKLCDMSRP